MLGLVLVYDQLGVGVVALARLHVDEAGRMVGMHVGEENGLDVGGIDAGGLDVGHQLAGGGTQVVARPSLDQGEAAG